MKRKTAKEILAESFQELAETTNIEKITIRDIVDNCGYSTATFYRHYTDKYDLIASCYAEQMGAIMERMGKDGYSWEDAYADSVEYYQDNREYLSNLFRHTSGLDSFVRNMTEINCSIYETYFREHFPDQPLDDKTRMKIRLFCHGASRLVSEWILGQYRVSVEDMTVVLKESFPFPLP